MFINFTRITTFRAEPPLGVGGGGGGGPYVYVSQHTVRLLKPAQLCLHNLTNFVWMLGGCRAVEGKDQYSFCSCCSWRFTNALIIMNIQYSWFWPNLSHGWPWLAMETAIYPWQPWPVRAPLWQAIVQSRHGHAVVKSCHGQPIWRGGIFRNLQSCHGPAVVKSCHGQKWPWPTDLEGWYI